MLSQKKAGFLILKHFALNHRGQESGFFSLNWSTQHKWPIFWSVTGGAFYGDASLDAPSHLLLVLVSSGVLYVYFCQLQLELPLTMWDKKGGSKCNC